MTLRYRLATPEDFPAILAMLPPTAVVVLMQKWFVKGLVDTEK